MKTAFFFCFEVYYYIDYIAVQTLVHNVWKLPKKSHLDIKGEDKYFSDPINRGRVKKTLMLLGHLQIAMLIADIGTNG